MQAIVVAIDFSNISLHALEYTIPLANKFKADILMVWVDKISPTESLYPDTSNQNRLEAIKRFEEVIKQYSKRMGKGLKLEYKLKKGKVYHEIDHLARSEGAGLIIAGTHGISGFEEYWIGSNAYKIVTYSSSPVIVVRHDYPIKKSIHRILAPIDSSSETIQKLPYIVTLAKLFKSEVHVLATHSSHLTSIQRLAEKYVQQATSYLFANEVPFVEDSIVSNDLTKATLQYATDVGMDLISIMTEQETPSNALLGLRAQQIISQSPMPVLSIHPQENFCLQ
ncbi:MAG: universal stress protein [Bacteroidales bacterium]|nr:universal stress protein [Bacteroidales bacterium]